MIVASIVDLGGLWRYNQRVQRIWAAIALVAGGTVGVSPQLGELSHLRLVRPPIVWLTAGRAVHGASDADIAYAIDLCDRERPLEVRTLTPDTEGACSPRRFVQEGPELWVWTDGYGIDRTEVTHADWRRCVIAGRCPPARVRDDDLRLAAPQMPVAGITFDEALSYCRFVGGRLPTEHEWERAARGHRRRRFPWGRLYNSRLANHGRSPAGPDDSDGHTFAAPVGSYPSGASSYGLLDVAGNVWEWTASSPGEDDIGPGADASIYRVIRGGSWAQPAETLRVTHRVWVPSAEHQSDLGFRCAYDPRGELAPPLP